MFIGFEGNQDAELMSRDQENRHEARIAEQMRLAAPYADSKPSMVTEVFWIYATRREGTYPGPTARSGKWIVLGDAARIDDLWTRIKVATEEGRLGGRSKVSTAKPNPTAADPNTKAICVYTYDSDDVDDVMRVRQELRALGVVEKVGYKTDERTMAGVYVSAGYRPEDVRKYFE